MKKLFFILLLIPLGLFGQIKPIVRPTVRVTMGPTVGIPSGVAATASVPEYQAVHDAFTVAPPADKDFAWSAMVTNIDQAGYWDSIDVWHWYGVHSSADADVYMNWKLPTGGPDIVTNGTFDEDEDWIKGPGWVIADDKLTATLTTAHTAQEMFTIGKTYHITFTISDFVGVGSNVSLDCGTTVGINREADGTYSEVLKCVGNDSLYIDAGGAFSGSIDNVIVKEWTNATPHNSPTFTAYHGIKGGGGAYVDWNWNPAISGVNYSLNSATLAVVATSDTNENYIDIGINNASITPRRSGSFRMAINSAPDDRGNVAHSFGVFSGSRTASNLQTAIHNKSVIIAGTDVSVSVPSYNMFSLASNNAGSPTALSSRQIICDFAGGGLSNTAIQFITDEIESCLITMGTGSVVNVVPPSWDTYTWAGDSVVIHFKDNSGGTAAHYVYASRDGGAFEVVDTIAAGETTGTHRPWQNADYDYYLRGVRNDTLSMKTPTQDLSTPLVFKTDQDPLDSITIEALYINTGGTVTLDWGDGADTTFVAGSDNDSISHSYDTPADSYYITISGDLDSINTFELRGFDQVYGDISKWQWPTQLGVLHFYGNNLSGDVSDWDLTRLENNAIFHVADQNLTGVFPFDDVPESTYDLQLYNNNIEGDLTDHVWSNRLGHIELRGNPLLGGDLTNMNFPNIAIQGGAIGLAGCDFEADITGWRFDSMTKTVQLSNINYDPTNDFYGSVSGWVFGKDPVGSGSGFAINCAEYPLTGTLHNAVIPEATGVAVIINFSDTDVTGFPGGHFKNVSVFNFQNANCDLAEINRFLTYLDNYFASSPPERNATYTLDGTGMGTITATESALITSIQSAYTLAGFTATFYVNE